MAHWFEAPMKPAKQKLWAQDLVLGQQVSYTKSKISDVRLLHRQHCSTADCEAQLALFLYCKRK